MASNLLNPIQLLRGTSAAIAAAQGKEGTLYYDTDRGTLQVKGSDRLYIVPRLQEDTTQSFVIHVNASTGNDSNSGYTPDKPLRTLNRALEIVQGVCGIRRPIIRMYAGEYTWDDDILPGLDISVAFSGAESGVILNMDGHGFYTCHASFTNMTINSSKQLVMYTGFIEYINCTVNITGQIDGTGCIQSYHSGAVMVQDTILDCNNNYCTYGYIADDGSSMLFIGDNNIIRNIQCYAVLDCSNGSSMRINRTIQNGGNVTGRRYKIEVNSSINTSGKGPNTIPGSQDGTVDSTSVFV